MKYYKNSAIYYGRSLASASVGTTSPYMLKCNVDDGVFKVDSYSSLTHGTIYPASPTRAYYSNPDLASFGSTNMSTTNCYGMSVMKENNYNHSSGITVTGLIISVTQGSEGTKSSPVYRSNTVYAPHAGCAKVEKVDFVEEVSYFETGIGRRTGEIVYASGWTLFGLDADGSIFDTRSIILARCTTSEKPTLKWSTSNIPRCENSSLVFSGDGSKLYGLLGDNGTPLSSKVSISMPEDAIAGNNGLLAVSCMATLDGNAAWLGYKNGIYKLYQGPTPLNGMPGEKITIKGHEFVCLAYGPFYARLS